MRCRFPHERPPHTNGEQSKKVVLQGPSNNRAFWSLEATPTLGIPLPAMYLLSCLDVSRSLTPTHLARRATQVGTNTARPLSMATHKTPTHRHTCAPARRASFWMNEIPSGSSSISAKISISAQTSHGGDRHTWLFHDLWPTIWIY